MKEAGLEPLSQTLGLSDDRFLNGMNSIQMILEQDRRITAVLCGNDEVAHGAWESLQKAGLNVPHDVSLVGFDDQHGMARLQTLTSVRVEAAEVGRQLAKMAIAKIKSKGRRLPEILLPTSLVKRETCRPLLQPELKTEER